MPAFVLLVFTLAKFKVTFFDLPMRILSLLDHTWLTASSPLSIKVENQQPIADVGQ